MIAPADRNLGRYRILRKLGRGAGADVYLARDTELGHNVSLKVIEDSSDAETRSVIEGERRGAELQACLGAIDPRVVRVYESGDTDGYFFVAMEYIDGQDLAELMRVGPLAVEFAVDVAVAVAETLEHAHNLQIQIEGREFRGIVHGDIAPKSIRIDELGQVRVLDFGIARALSLSRRLTRHEFGSVPYASPERLETCEVDVGSDLWSLAAMLYEMVTGMQPYHAESTEQLECMIRSGIAPPPPDPCPEPLRRILMKALNPDPKRRYESAGQLRVDLLKFQNGEATIAEADYPGMQALNNQQGSGSVPQIVNSDADITECEQGRTRTSRSYDVATRCWKRRYGIYITSFVTVFLYLITNRGRSQEQVFFEATILMFVLIFGLPLIRRERKQ